jgi:hypothetical protein
MVLQSQWKQWVNTSHWCSVHGILRWFYGLILVQKKPGTIWLFDFNWITWSFDQYSRYSLLLLPWKWRCLWSRTLRRQFSIDCPKWEKSRWIRPSSTRYAIMGPFRFQLRSSMWARRTICSLKIPIKWKRIHEQWLNLFMYTNWWDSTMELWRSHSKLILWHKWVPSRSEHSKIFDFRI